MEEVARKTKNIIKRELTAPDGVIFYSFISRTTGPVLELEEHINNLILSSQPYNTVKAKASDLAKFYDYFIEASDVLHTQEFEMALSQSSSHSPGFHLRTTLTNIFYAYPSYLLDGKESKNPLAKICALNLDAIPLKRTSAKRMISSLCEFVTASNALEYSLMQQRKLDGLIDVDQAFTAVGRELGAVIELSSSQRKALLEHSYLASCISGGAKVAQIKNFFKLPPEPKVKKEKHFPIDEIGRFLLSTKSHRDRCMYSLCFGGGLRFSEAKKLRFRDIDVIKEKVRLHDKDVISYLHGIDYKTLNGKPIDHFDVHFIEPFKSFFFDELMKYLEEERPESNSEYVFLQGRATANKLTDQLEHQPYYRSAQSTIKDAWDLNLQRAGLTDSRFDDIGTHSMRHFYGVYMVNYAPHPRGSYGYPLNEVQYLMRHTQLKNTKIYTMTASFEKMARDIEVTNQFLLQREADFYSDIRQTTHISITNQSHGK